jgi:hypothetical protein
MKRPVWIAILVVVVLGIAAWAIFRPRANRVAVDLIARFQNTEEKRPRPDIFSLVDATLAGETKRAIEVDEPSRIAWTVTVPDNAVLVLSAGWTVPGDGVVFHVAADDDALLDVVVNPYGNEKDRRWQDFTLDLSEYSGQTVNIFLKTNSSRPGHDDRNGDFAVWGSPRIVTR